LLESLFLHDAIEHVSNPDKFILPAVDRSDGHSILSSFLSIQSILKVLSIIHKIFSGDGQHPEVLFVAMLLPSEESFGHVDTMQVDNT
jgi:hypothetical protein